MQLVQPYFFLFPSDRLRNLFRLACPRTSAKPPPLFTQRKACRSSSTLIIPPAPSFLNRGDIPSIAVGGKYLMGYLELCGCLTPVFDGITNLIYDFGCFLTFQHVVTACCKQGFDIRQLGILVDKQTLLQFSSRVYVVCR